MIHKNIITMKKNCYETPQAEVIVLVTEQGFLSGFDGNGGQATVEDAEVVNGSW